MLSENGPFPVYCLIAIVYTACEFSLIAKVMNKGACNVFYRYPSTGFIARDLQTESEGHNLLTHISPRAHARSVSKVRQNA